MQKVEYVAGFLFDSAGKRVVLIEKQRPEWQRGRFNGIGGHIEPGETPEQAMRREFREETAVDVSSWMRFATLKGVSDVEWTVHFFSAFSTHCANSVRRVTDEIPIPFGIDELGSVDILPNLSWLIPMALSMAKDRAAEFVIQEVYAVAAV